MPRLHVPWGSSHRWAGFFSVFKSFNFSDIEYISSSMAFYYNMIKIQKCVTFNQARGYKQGSDSLHY